MPTEVPPGGEVLDRARKGSPSAFNRLLAAARSGIERRAARRMGRRSIGGQSQSDISQEAMVRGWRLIALGRFRGRTWSEWKAWLLTATDRGVRDEARKHERREQLYNEALADGRRPFPVQSGPNLDQLIRQEQIEVTLRAVHSLDPRLAQVIRQTLAGVSTAEIAAALNLSERRIQELRESGSRQIVRWLREQGHLTDGE